MKPKYIPEMNDTKTDIYLNDLYFNTKSPVAFTGLVPLYREAKKKIPSLTLARVRLWL